LQSSWLFAGPRLIFDIFVWAKLLTKSLEAIGGQQLGLGILGKFFVVELLKEIMKEEK